MVRDHLKLTVFNVNKIDNIKNRLSHKHVLIKFTATWLSTVRDTVVARKRAGTQIMVCLERGPEGKWWLCLLRCKANTLIIASLKQRLGLDHN